jgi:hypothetical protein
MVGCTKMVSKLAWDMKEESFNFEIWNGHEDKDGVKLTNPKSFIP